MNSPRYWPASGHYPAPQNHLLDDPTPKDQAVYIPSVTPAYAKAVFEAKGWRSMPDGVEVEHLNFMSPTNPLFRISHVMSSAGQALKVKGPCILRERQRASTILVGDSGGYQVGQGKLQIKGDADRLRILQWLEARSDLAMTLDVPTGPVGSPGYAFNSVKECLDATLVHLDHFKKNRTPGKIRLLNVLQGNTQAQSDDWYNAVKPYEFDGWAIAGPLRHNFRLLCRRIILMANEGQLDNKNWIHVLGTSELETAVLLTALQRAINRHINPDLRISFDTSSPFRMMRYRRVYALPKFERKRMTMASVDAPNDAKFLNSGIRWPWPSPLGDHMTLGDFCVKPPKGKHYLDTQSYYYLANHNLAALCFGIALANRIFDANMVSGSEQIGAHLVDAAAAIDKVIASRSLVVLGQYEPAFKRLRHDAENHDEDRKLIEPGA